MLECGLHDVPAGKLAMIVTYLEMTTAPALKDAQLPSDLDFRQVRPDLAWYRDIFTRVGAMDWLWYGRLRLSDDALRVILDDPKVLFFTISVNGTDEALLELDFRGDGECEIAYFGVTQALIGKGVGRFLMNEAITRAFARDVGRLHVHTCTIDSPQALDFYVRSGFRAVRRAVEVDDDPRSIGVLPQDAAPRLPII